METKCALDLSAGQIPAMPNHFIPPVDHFKRSHFREDSSREPPLSLPDLVCPIWLIYLLPPENT